MKREFSFFFNLDLIFFANFMFYYILFSIYFSVFFTFAH